VPVLPPKPPLKPGAAAKPLRPEDAIQKARREKEELEGECGRLEEELEALKVKYEQYFLGVERKEPVRWREELKKKVLRVKEAFTRNAGLKFRVQSLYARFLSYERLWLRSAREKEEGTYRRDVFKARLRAHHDEGAAQPAPEPTKAPEKAAATPAPAATAATAAARPTSGAPAAAGGAPKAAAGAPAGPARPAAPRPAAPPPSASAGGIDTAQMRALYNAYIAAKKSCNEDVSRLTYDAVATSVSKQIPELMTRFKAKTVEFKVEVKAGKAILKAIPKA
jgi:hypothetical protein